MITVDEEWWIAEAGEYVLGTLRGTERVLFERFIDRDPDIRALVEFWENCFYPLNELTPAVEPAPALWNRILASIEQTESAPGDNSASATVTPIAKATTLPTTTQPSNTLGDHEQRNIKPHVLLRALTSLALAASLLLGVLLVYKLQQAPTGSTDLYDTMSVIASEQGNGLWAVTANSTSNTVKVIALAPPQINSSKDYQLWQIKPDNSGVSSVGLLAQENGQVQKFTPAFPIAESVAFAVSLEPKGGSPNAVPSGPVLFSGTITKLDESI